MEARRRLQAGQMGEFRLDHGWEIHKIAALDVSQSADPLLLFCNIRKQRNLHNKLQEKHRQSKEEEEEKDSCATREGAGKH